MSPPPDSHFGTLPRPAVAAILAAAMVGVLVLLAPADSLAGRLAAAAAALAVTFADGGLAAMIVAAAGGWGFLLCRRLLPADAPAPLRVITSCGLGLWVFSTLVLAVGSAIPGSLTGWVWWPLVAAGVVLAAWQGRARMESWQMPSRFDGRVLAWALVAAAAAVWVSGAVSSPAYVGGLFGDRYDVLEYHLQVPREFYEAGRIGPLDHNVYSNYPLGLENLFLMAMCLRGGPWAGMHAGAFLHGSLAVLAVAAVFLTLRKTDETRARFSAVLLATTPAVLYLSRLAMVEMAQLFYLALAMLWLRQWLPTPTWRTTACIGLTLGAACATKYLAVGFVVAPVLGVMLGSALLARRAHHLIHPLAAGCLALAMLGPWMVRNAVHTGNPVFPLATQVFGRGHWTAQQEQRWISGHTPGVHPPVPRPTGWQPPRSLGRGDSFIHQFVTQSLFGYLMMLAGALTLALMIADRKLFTPWDLALAGVLVVQLTFWTAFTRDMPWRFIVPAMLPMCLLAGEGLAKLSRLPASPFRPGAQAGLTPWGRVPAVAILIAAAAVNLATAVSVAGVDGAILLAAPPPAPEEKPVWPASARVLLVGQAQAFAEPVFAFYATTFDTHPLEALINEGLGPQAIGDRIKRMGVTHIYVDWHEISRLAYTYGYPACLSAGLYERYKEGLGPQLAVLEALKKTHGLEVLRQEWPTSRPGTKPAAGKGSAEWPLATVYVFPWGK